MSDHPDFLDWVAGRPDHPDFWRLADVVLQQDGMTEDADFDLPAWVGEVCDFWVVMYMGGQRGMRMGVPEIIGASLWLDGFMAGARYATRDSKED